MSFSSLLALALAMLFAGSPALAGDRRDRSLRSCGFDPIRLATIAQGNCHFPKAEPLSPHATDVEIKLHKVQTFLDGSVGAALFYNQDLTDALLISCLNEATTGEGSSRDWCAMFAVNSAVSVDERFPKEPSVIKPGKYGQTDSLMSAHKLLTRYEQNSAAFIPPSEAPEPGCLALWQSEDGKQGHVAIVLGVDGEHMKTVEGNVRVNPNFDRNTPAVDGNHTVLLEDRKWRDGGRSSFLAEKTNKTNLATQPKRYRGCVRLWPPAPGEEKAWKDGLTKLQSTRYQNLRAFRFEDRAMAVQSSFGSCHDDWKSAIGLPPGAENYASSLGYVKYLFESIVPAMGSRGAAGSGTAMDH